MAFGRRLTAFAHIGRQLIAPTLACFAVACPIFPPSPVDPQFPQAPLLCSHKPTRPGHKTYHSNKYALGELGWEPVLLSLGPCWGRAGDAKDLFHPSHSTQRSTTQQQPVIPYIRLLLPFMSSPPATPQEPPKSASPPIVASHVLQVLSLQPQVAKLPASLEIGLVPSQSPLPHLVRLVQGDTG